MLASLLLGLLLFVGCLARGPLPLALLLLRLALGAGLAGRQRRDGGLAGPGRVAHPGGGDLCAGRVRGKLLGLGRPRGAGLRLLWSRGLLSLPGLLRRLLGRTEGPGLPRRLASADRASRAVVVCHRVGYSSESVPRPPGRVTAAPHDGPWPCQVRWQCDKDLSPDCCRFPRRDYGNSRQARPGGNRREKCQGHARKAVRPARPGRAHNALGARARRAGRHHPRPDPLDLTDPAKDES